MDIELVNYSLWLTAVAMGLCSEGVRRARSRPEQCQIFSVAVGHGLSVERLVSARSGHRRFTKHGMIVCYHSLRHKK